MSQRIAVGGTSILNRRQFSSLYGCFVLSYGIAQYLPAIRHAEETFPRLPQPSRQLRLVFKFSIVLVTYATLEGVHSITDAHRLS